MSFEVIAPRSALLSNFEVLTLLRELESEQLARQKTALRVKKEEEERERAAAAALLSVPGSKAERERLEKGRAAGANEGTTSQINAALQEDVCENLRTVEFEAIQYLTADYQPTHAQSEDSIARLVKALASYDLTKAEKLQIVNLAPTEAVELYVIVEEIEDRLGDRMDEVLDIVRKSLASSPTAQTAQTMTEDASAGITYEYVETVDDGMYDEGQHGWGEGGYEEVYDDHGEGAGIEGDLEMDED